MGSNAIGNGNRYITLPVVMKLKNPCIDGFFILRYVVILMLTMNTRIKRPGFTIVELLIVIVVIGVLAGIVVVAYNGIQNRARTSQAKTEILNSAKFVATERDSQALSSPPAPAAISSQLKVGGTGVYSIYTYCASDTSFVVAARLANGDVFYSIDGKPIVQNNSINAFSPCAALSIVNTNATAAAIGYPGMATSSCAAENGSCTFTGKASVAYGDKPTGRMIVRTNLSSPVSCTYTNFGSDPAVGTLKYCYVLSY